MVMGLLNWVLVIPLALLMVKQRPEVMGLLPDGRTQEDRKTSSAAKETKGPPPESGRRTLKGILRLHTFWLIAAIYLMFFLGQFSIIMHSFSLFTDKGIPAVTASTMVSIIGLFSFTGKIALGYLSDRLPVRYVMMGTFALEAVAILLLLLVKSAMIGWLFVLLWGFTMGGMFGLLPLLVGKYFSREIIGKMLGIFAICSSIGHLLGSPFMGYSFDLTGSYNLALFVFAALHVLSLVLVFFIRPPRETASPTA